MAVCHRGEQGIEVHHLRRFALYSAHKVQKLVNDAIHVAYILDHASLEAGTIFVGQHFH